MVARILFEEAPALAWDFRDRAFSSSWTGMGASPSCSNPTFPTGAWILEFGLILSRKR
jgi:hypothetical protein